MDKQAAIELIDSYISGTASAAEKEQFFHLLEDDGQFASLFEEILQEQYNADVFETEPNEKLRSLIQARLQRAIREQEPKETARLVTFRRIAAAAIVLFVVGGLWLMLNKKSGVDHPQTTVAKTNDIEAPKETRAVITLADGTKVYLDSAENGTIAQQNNVAVVRNKEGEIIYAMSPAGGGGLNDSPNDKRPGVDYNTLSNPRGSKVISLTLSDGTKVWLNSESSLKYPTVFNTGTRDVEITGEAYFEVAHNASKPFHVKKGETDVTVLGTHFNVNAYADEESLKVTLLEGSVQVSLRNSASSAVKIKPGEQAVVNTTSHSLLTTGSVDTDAVMAWKNGFFSLENTNIETVMRQMARWYDIQVVYESKPTKIFRGSIPREMSAAKVLNALEETGGVHFKIDGRKVTVMK
jgi:transmembrane sensor